MTAEQLKDPTVNVEIGAAYLAQLRERYDGDDTMALAAYNAGIVNADRVGDARAATPRTHRLPGDEATTSTKVLQERDTLREAVSGGVRRDERRT